MNTSITDTGVDKPHPISSDRPSFIKAPHVWSVKLSLLAICYVKNIFRFLQFFFTPPVVHQEPLCQPQCVKRSLGTYQLIFFIRQLCRKNFLAIMRHLETLRPGQIGQEVLSCIQLRLTEKQSEAKPLTTHAPISVGV